MIPIHDTVPGRHPPIATWAIILANCGLFLLEISLPEHGLERLFYLFGTCRSAASRRSTTSRNPTGAADRPSPATSRSPSRDLLCRSEHALTAPATGW